MEHITSDYTYKHYFRDLIRHLPTLRSLIERELSLRYKQTVLGMGWALIKPLISTLTLYFVFSSIKSIEFSGPSFFLMVFAALLPWQLFSSAISDSTQVMVDHFPLITKVYFPRLLLPIQCLITNSADYLISLVFFSGLLFIMHGTPPHPIYWIGLTTLLFLLTLGVSFFLSGLYVRYRDLRFIIPMMTQLGLILSPIAYSTSLLSDKAAKLYYLNPMAGLIECMRWALLGVVPKFPLLAISSATLIPPLLFVLGLVYFKNLESEVADIL